MDRTKAYQLLTTYIQNPNLIKHHLATEAVMCWLCQKFYKDAKPELIEKWGVVGLLHDADYERTKDIPEKHGLMMEERLRGEIPEDILYAIKAHNWHNTKAEPLSLMDWSMYCCDELTGLIIASALVHPQRKLAALDTDFVLNRMKEKSFAKGADREHMKMCETKLKIPLRDFVEIALKAMQSIGSELGL